MKNIVNELNYPLHEVINMASLNPAKAVGFDEKYGSIEKGKYADIILLDNNFELKQVMKKGILVK